MEVEQRVTFELIEAGKSSRGGWTREQLACLGVSWPPPKGWGLDVTGTWIDEAKVKQFLALKGQTKKHRKHRNETKEATTTGTNDG